MSKSIDEIIREATARGEFDNLPGQGQPLKLDDYFDMPEDIRLTYSVLKNANYLPEEVVLLKEIAEIQEKLNSATDTHVRKKYLQDIEARRLKYNLRMERFSRHR
jgi:hypothetical protein